MLQRSCVVARHTLCVVRAGSIFACLSLTGGAIAQTAHCFNDLHGPEVPCTAPGGGTSAAPAPRGPSPAETADRQRRAKAHAANDRGLSAFKRKDYATALRELENTIQGNYWFVKGDWAIGVKHDLELGKQYLLKARQYSPNNKSVLSYLKLLGMAQKGVQGDKLWSRASTAAEHGDWDLALSLQRDLLTADFDKLYENDLRLLTAGQALASQQWATAANALREYARIEAEHMQSVHKDDPSKARAWAEFANAAIDALERGDVTAARLHWQKLGSLGSLDSYEDPYIKGLMAELDRQSSAETQRNARQEPAQALSPNDSNCTGWVTANGKSSRLCMDAQAHRYCEEASGGSVLRVNCQ